MRDPRTIIAGVGLAVMAAAGGVTAASAAARLPGQAAPGHGDGFRAVAQLGHTATAEEAM
jgi:hypothetical protein